MIEKLFKVEEFHRGKWMPLIKDDGGQKTVRITEKNAERMNFHSSDMKIRYILSEEGIEEKKDSNKSSDIALDSLKEKYTQMYGKKPFHGWGEDKLKELIEEKK